MLILLIAAGSAPVEGGSPGGFSIDRYTIDGGGGTSTGGQFSLTGTIGQYDASPVSAQGGPYTIYGGFWGGSKPNLDDFFRDGFENP